MADTRQDESQSNSRSRDASLPIDRLNELIPSNSPASFENGEIEDSIANDISDPCKQDKRMRCIRCIFQLKLFTGIVKVQMES